MATALEPRFARDAQRVRRIARFAEADAADATAFEDDLRRPGYLLFVEDGALLAQRFDTAKLRLIGEPMQVADGVLPQKDRQRQLLRLGQRRAGVSGGGDDRLASSGTIDVETSLTRAGRYRITARSILAGRPTSRRRCLPILGPARPTSGSPTRRVARPFDSRRIPTTRAGRCGRRTAAASCSEAIAAGPRVFASDRRRRICTRERRHRSEELVVADRVRCTRRTGRATADGCLHPKHAANSRGHLAHAARQGGKPCPFSSERFDERARGSRPTRDGSRSSRLKPVRRKCTSRRWANRAHKSAYPLAAERRRAGAAMVGSCSTRPRITGRSCGCHQSGSTFAAGAPARCSPSAPRLRPPAPRGIVYDVSPDGRFLVGVPAGQPSASRITVVLNWAAGLND